MGTLVVWLDDGIASDEPLLAVPINLSVLLDLPQDQVLHVHLFMCTCVVSFFAQYPNFVLNTFMCADSIVCIMPQALVLNTHAIAPLATLAINENELKMRCELRLFA